MNEIEFFLLIHSRFGSYRILIKQKNNTEFQKIIIMVCVLLFFAFDPGINKLINEFILDVEKKHFIEWNKLMMMLMIIIDGKVVI